MSRFTDPSNGTPNQSDSKSKPVRKTGRHRFFPALRRTIGHKFLLGFLCMVSLVAGVSVARYFGKETWVSVCTLNYEIPKEANSKISPSLKTMLALVKDPVGMQKTLSQYGKRSDFSGSPISIKTFDQNLSAVIPAKTNQLLLKLQWTDPESAHLLLDEHVRQSFIEWTDHNKRKTTKEETPKLKLIDQMNQQIAKLDQEKKESLSRSGVTDARRDINSLKDKITSLEFQFRELAIKEVGAKEEYREIGKKMERIKSSAVKVMDSEDEDLALPNSTIENRALQDRIRQLMADEKQRISEKASLEAKINEKKQVDELIKQGKTNPEVSLRLASEIYELQARSKGSKNLTAWDNELQKLDKLMVPRKAKTTGSFPIITNLLDKQIERELAIHNIAQQMDHSQKEMESAKAKLAYLVTVDGKNLEIEGKIAVLEKEKAALLSTLTDPVESLSSVQVDGPSTGVLPEGSNRPFLFFSVFLSGSGLSILAVLLYELVAGIRSPVEMAKSLQIPVQWIASGPVQAEEDFRALCRSVRTPGFLAKSVLQIQGLGADAALKTKTRQTMDGLAEGFSRRGEKVLLIDLCETSSTMPGLSEFLQSESLTLEGLEQPTTNPKITRMFAGKEPVNLSQLTDPRLKLFLEMVLKNHGVVLIQGQGLTEFREVQALALVTHGLVVVSAGNRKVEPLAREALLDVTGENLVPRALVIV